MDHPRICTQCSRSLPADAPGGICPKCLLGLGIAEGANATVEYSSPAGKPFLAPTPEEIAQYFPHLEMLELLGQGGMGAVYKARQPGLDRLVAVKILPSQISRTPGFAERFAREGRALARLSHPNIVTVYDSGERDGLFYFIMEFIDGTNLREMTQAGDLSPREAMAIVPQICEALQFAHESGIVHRDIKPENILVDKTGRVKIADFGLAKLASGESKLPESEPSLVLTGTHQVMGTPRYMAPEQIEGSHHVDHRADIYSLGVVFYELLTGELPLGRFDPPSHKVQVDVRLDEVVLRTLEKSPDRRYQQASEIKTDVETIERSPASPSATTTVDTPLPQPALADQSLIAEGRFLPRGPAIGFLIVAAAASLIAMLWSVPQRLNPFVDSKYASSVTTVLIFVLIYGATAGILGVQMLRRSWHLFTGILAVALAFPVPAVIANLFLDAEWSRRQDVFWPTFVVSLLGMPVAIWACAILWRKSVMSAYRHAFNERIRAAENAQANKRDTPADPRRTVGRPAIGLIALGVLYLLLAPALLASTGSFLIGPPVDAWPAILIFLLLAAGLALTAGLTVVVAASRMRNLRGYRLAVTAAILVMLPITPIAIPGLVIGIWTLWVLLRDDVSEAFAERAKRQRDDQADSQLGDEAAEHAPLPAKPFASVIIEAAESLKTPGKGLILSGVLVLLLSLPTTFVLIEGIMEELFGKQWADAPLTYFYLAAVLVLSVASTSLQVVAGVSMRNCRRRGLCLAGAIVAMLPISLGWIITAPLGLWALVMLLQNDVRAAFAAGINSNELTARERFREPPKPRPLEESPYYAAGWLIGGVLRFATSATGTAVFSFLAAATVVLPWGYFTYERVHGSSHYFGSQINGFSFWSGDIIGGLMFLCGLFLLATGSLQRANLWRPLIVVGFALPTVALLIGFSQFELSMLGGAATVDGVSRITGVNAMGGYYICWVLVSALLIAASLQVRLALQENERDGPFPG